MDKLGEWIEDAKEYEIGITINKKVLNKIDAIQDRSKRLSVLPVHMFQCFVKLMK